jgi:hypothetical protein
MGSTRIIFPRRVGAALLTAVLAVVGCDVVSDMTGDDEAVPPLPTPDSDQVSYSSYHRNSPMRRR